MHLLLHSVRMIPIETSIVPYNQTIWWFGGSNNLPPCMHIKFYQIFRLFSIYRNSGNFRVKKFSSIKFPYQNIFVPATPYRSNMLTLYTAMKNFVHLIFVHNCAYEIFLTTKISRTTVYASTCMNVIIIV